MDLEQLYDGKGIQKFWNLYLIDQPATHPWAELSDAPTLIQAGVVTQWGLIQVFVAPTRQGLRGVVRTTQAVQAAARSRGFLRGKRDKGITSKQNKEFDVFAEKYYRMSPSKRFKERRKDLYESSSPLQRDILDALWTLERQSSNFNPNPWILAMFGGSAYVLLWAYIVGYRL